MFLNRDSDTICAVATPAGVGGISVIRISGDKSSELISKLCPRLKKDSLESHRAYFSEIRNIQSGVLLDEGIVTFFKKGQSYTGEETAEISCHGNPRICESILRTLIEDGARLADRGEFTYRAFMNGKIDLVQAESVLATIESQSHHSTQLALRQLKGELSSTLMQSLDLLTWTAAHIEAGIDFSAEGLDTIETSTVIQKLTLVEETFTQLLNSYRSGRIVREGFRIVLVGKPNVGKSSLLNLLLQDDRAIVTPIAGTTRDLVEGSISFNGLQIIFTDTAGLRDSDDVVERIGIERSKKALSDADAVLWVVDGYSGIDEEDFKIVKLLNSESIWICVNKSDLGIQDSVISKLRTFVEQSNFFASTIESDAFFEDRVLSVSAVEPHSRDTILGHMAGKLLDKGFESSVSLSHARHFEAICFAKENIQRCRLMLKQGDGAEFITFELKEAIMKVQEVLGKRFDDEIMDRVFKEFCIGK